MSELTSESVMSAFVEACEQNGHLPQSLKDFATRQGYDLPAVKSLFSTQLILEQQIYCAFFKQSIELLNKDDAYAEYSPQERILAFYYTWFEILEANRKYVELSLKQGLAALARLPKLLPLRYEFCDYIRSLDLPLLTPVLDIFKPIQQGILAEAAWTQFLTLLGYWLQDTSPEKARTDMLIEKSVAAATEVGDALSFTRTVDWVRFWIEELAPGKSKQ